MPDIILPSVPNSADTGPDTEFDAALSFAAPEPLTDNDTPSDPQDIAPADPTPDADSAPVDPASEPEPINTRPATSGNTQPHGDPAKALASSTPQRRDYTKFPAELMPFVKRMRNDEFAQAEKILPALYAKAQERDQIAAERDRLQTEASSRPSFVHEHPNGYVLDEQYQAAEQDVARGQYELEFYQEQLARVEAGQEWQHAMGWDKNGQLQARTIPASQNGQVDPQARAILNQRILSAAMVTRERAAARDQFVQNYSQQAQAVKGELAEVEAKIFHKLAPEKFTPEEKRLCDMAVNAFPRAFRSSPVVKYLGWAAVGSMRTNKAYAELASKYKALLTKGATTARANPRPAPGSVMPGRDSGEVVYDLKKLAEEYNS